MKRNGNVNSNRTYNPQNSKPHMPLDVDEVDAVLERFIRQKYDQQAFSNGTTRPPARHDTGSTRSSEDQPPPLPPKPAKRFGFGLRSASSTFPLSRSSQISPPESPVSRNSYGQPPSPLRVNKQSRIFGASVGGTTGDNIESKLATLRDMGFPDEKRNANILKGLSGNLERAIESLVRLGEGSTPASMLRTSLPTKDNSAGQPLNLSLSTSRAVSQSTAIKPAVNPLAQQIEGSFQPQANNQTTVQAVDQASQSFNFSNPFQSQSYNPFETSNLQSATYPPERAFEGMQLSQPLFPNATGGYPSQQQQFQDARLQQSMTPPVPQPPHHHYQSNSFVQQTRTPTGSFNPFFHNSQQVASNSSVSYPFNGQHQQIAAPSYNPFTHSPPITQSPSTEYPFQTPQIYRQEVQSQQQSQQQPQQQVQQSQSSLQQPPFGYDATSQGQQPFDPYVLQHPTPANVTASQFQQSQISNQLTSQSLRAEQIGRFDKSSILALYNYPQLAPPSLPSNAHQSAPLASPTITGQPSDASATQQKRSVTMPAALSSGSRNPFHTVALNPQAATGPHVVNGGISRHVSQESVDIGGFQNGRHSPDAFASLSARIVR